MESRENSKLLQSNDKQEQYTSPYLCCPNTHIHSNNNLYPMEFHMLNNIASTAKRANSNLFHVPSGEASSGYCDVPHGEQSFENSDSGSNSEVGDASESDEEVSLDELLHDGKAKKKIEQLAAMVGVDTTEPAIVLSEVVKLLKHLKRLN
ncbi:hypothetical protein SESBI_34898 [Sesbania bispinosa]|nr:hypothetical protein SESBI_34898 [Sesbania bispinosa]